MRASDREGAPCRNPARSCAANHPDGLDGGAAFGLPTVPAADPPNPSEPPWPADPDTDVRRNVADNTNTTPDALPHLAADTDDWVRWRVAGHPNTPPEALTALAADPESWVRAAAAGNPNTPAADKAAAGLLKD